MCRQGIAQRQQKSPFVRTGFRNRGSLEGIPGRAARAPNPQAKAFGRIPKNCPLGSFLDGIPPHRFESPQPDQKYKTGQAIA